MTDFGPYRLTESGLMRDGKPVAVGARGLALLAALADADGPVGKAALMEAGWPGAIVEEGNITVQIAALRKALGTRDDGQEWVVTVPRVGYRLLRGEPVRETAEETRLPSIAVLPFQNMSGDPEQDYFADGVVEDVITALSRFRSFTVLARNSSFVFKGRTVDVREAARELGVRYILEGSVRRASERLRVTAQLVDGETGAHLWAHKFDGPLADVFDMQDAITGNVAAVIEPRIIEAEVERARRLRPGNPSAHDLYLQALSISENWRPEQNLQSLQLLDRALELDPTHAPTMVLAAAAREQRISQGWELYREDDRDYALALVERALDRVSDDAQVLARAALVMMQLGGRYERAVATAERAVALNPNDPMVCHIAGIINILGGDVDLAERQFLRSMQLNQRAEGDISMTGLAHIELIRGNYAKAADYAHRAISSHPNFNPAHWMLIAAYAHLGDLDAARRALAAVEKLAPGVRLSRTMRTANPIHAIRMEPVAAGLRLAGMPE